MANGEQPRERVAVQSMPRAAAPPETTRRPSFLRTALLILLAFLLLGAVPILLLGQLEGVWWVHLPGSPDYRHATATPAHGYTDNLPRQAWIAVTAQIYPRPAQTPALATLEPGYPVVVTAHASVHGALWSHVVWQGPSASTTGADGWTLDNALVGFGGGSRPIGDLGALSPALGRWAVPYNAQLAVALYFTDTGQLYHLNPTRSFALGSGFSSVLLADLYATAEARKSAPSPPEVSALAVRSPVTDSVVPAAAYLQLGGATGVSAFLTGAGITGLTPGASWTGAQATPSGMILLYAALESGALLTHGDGASLEQALQQANASATATLLGARTRPTGGYLVRAAAQTSAGWDVSACGVLRLPSGRLVVAVAVQSQSSQQAGDTLLTGFFAQVMAVAG